MKSIILMIFSLGFFAGCSENEEIPLKNCQAGESAEKCLERTIPEISGSENNVVGDTDYLAYALTASNNGDYATALQIWRAYAEQG